MVGYWLFVEAQKDEIFIIFFLFLGNQLNIYILHYLLLNLQVINTKN
jgi:hypothetical protein